MPLISAIKSIFDDGPDRPQPTKPGFEELDPTKGRFGEELSTPQNNYSLGQISLKRKPPSFDFNNYRGY